MPRKPTEEMTRDELAAQVKQLREAVGRLAMRTSQGGDLNTALIGMEPFSIEAAKPDEDEVSDDDFNRAFRDARGTVPGDIDLDLGDGRRDEDRV